MPKTAAGAMLAAGSMAGVPLFAGFLAKDQFYESVRLWSAGAWSDVALAAAVVSSALLGMAGLIAGVSPFIGHPASPAPSHEAPPSLWLGPLFLGCVGLIVGFLPSLIESPVTLATAAVLRDATPVRLTLWHGFTPTSSLSVLTLAGALSLFMSRERIGSLRWPRPLQTERLYTRALSALDAISRAVAPALQSASLRSYVLTIIATAVVLVGTALSTGRVLPKPNRWTPILPHEGIITAFIVAASFSAAFARSNMVAVLSLGAVGYGVALMYVLFGAPDLAMTQFAVETLTVVIFVLVFRQLRGFGDLSSGLIKTRDAIVAIAAGTLVFTLVLAIGTSGTASRLSPYFADAAPRLGHGRNIVNVVLVDFRGFDTLGEITVLVTVAIGVLALLRIGKERLRP
jgi:multicomponent Na+:H+ antiporter subunit A